MMSFSQIKSPGVAQQWPSRERVIESIANTTPWSIEPVAVYNSRGDAENTVLAPPDGAYVGVGVRSRGSNWQSTRWATLRLVTNSIISGM
jgi:hypothetical protein